MKKNDNLEQQWNSENAIYIYYTYANLEKNEHKAIEIVNKDGILLFESGDTTLKNAFRCLKFPFVTTVFCDYPNSELQEALPKRCRLVSLRDCFLGYINQNKPALWVQEMLFDPQKVPSYYYQSILIDNDFKNAEEVFYRKNIKGLNFMIMLHEVDTLRYLKRYLDKPMKQINYFRHDEK